MGSQFCIRCLNFGHWYFMWSVEPHWIYWLRYTTYPGLARLNSLSLESSSFPVPLILQIPHIASMRASHVVSWFLLSINFVLLKIVFAYYRPASPIRATILSSSVKVYQYLISRNAIAVPNSSRSLPPFNFNNINICLYTALDIISFGQKRLIQHLSYLIKLTAG